MTDVREINGVVPESGSGKRLDQVLAKMFPEFSRSRLKSLIQAEQVTVNGGMRRPRDPVYAGEPVTLTVSIEQDPGLSAESMPLAIVYQDHDVLVVNKPAGLVVHPGAGNATGTLVNGLLHYDPALADLPRAGLIHRLDKDTSGVLVVARTIAAHTSLTCAMQERRIHRQYLAICAGRLSGGGTVDEPIGRHTGDRTRMAVQAGGRESVTHYRVTERYRGNTLVTVTLETGRTHQIRVHFAHMGHSLVGDRVYGRPSFPRGASSALREHLAGFARQALHACKLEFDHPITGCPVSVSVPPPADFQALQKVLHDDSAQMTAAGPGDTGGNAR